MRTRRTNLRVVKEVAFDGHRFEISISRKRRNNALGDASVTSDSDSDEYQPDSSETDSEDELEDEHRLKRVKLARQTSRPSESDNDSETVDQLSKGLPLRQTRAASMNPQRSAGLNRTRQKPNSQTKRKRSPSCGCAEHSSSPERNGAQQRRRLGKKSAKRARISTSIAHAEEPSPVIKQERAEEDALSQARARSMELLANLQEVKQWLENANIRKGV
ncbi:uncharacterized protein EI97DRAFT_325565 [Westerdykella ornata]|uniref:Uncharacterized protein n=1 Tax=Westerdykella ornata TaxID=318751 RepID=A0A6A6JL13_WESOR|nr:uncharacterized protein EI97DRAFT_325565 [Westerdykella ornata]KAF2276925.1 hypothetical protein EI97DRAFT_325565 [Westerdykella ornata]